MPVRPGWTTIPLATNDKFLSWKKERLKGRTRVGRTPAETRDGNATANLNLKVTEDERWAFKEWCVKNRMSQVDGFRRAFELLKRHGAED